MYVLQNGVMLELDIHGVTVFKQCRTVAAYVIVIDLQAVLGLRARFVCPAPGQVAAPVISIIDQGCCRRGCQQ